MTRKELLESQLRVYNTKLKYYQKRIQMTPDALKRGICLHLILIRLNQIKRLKQKYDALLA